MAKIPSKVLLRLTSSLKKFQTIIKSAKEKDLNESDTSAIVMDMLAEIFGYKKYSEITSEYEVNKTYCDLAVKIDENLIFLIEIKAIGIELKPEHKRQVVGYGSFKGSDWVILTNGNQWKIYKITFEKPLITELIYEFELLNLNSKRITDIEHLYYLSKESIRKSALEDYLNERQSLNKFFISQIVLSNPVLESIRKTIRKIRPDVKVPLEEIKNVLEQEVFKREIIEDEKADEIKKSITKCFKSTLKKESSTKEPQKDIESQPYV
jgi:hypothetical protein